VRGNFLPLVPQDKNYSLEQFNNIFYKWRDDYHRKMHHGTLQAPLDRYLDDLKNTNIKRVSENELDLIFYRTYKRKVHNDATVSVNSILFEAPAAYIGAFVELRHPMGQPSDLWIFEDEQPIVKLHKIDVQLNSNSPTSGIRFSKNDQEDQ
jgi:hypothetical protein